MKHMLLTPYNKNGLDLKNRIVMAPLTRCRAGKERIANDLMAKYYQQRSGAGLIITEASQISPRAIGYMNTPGIYTEAQVEGWKKVTRAVHQAGGKIVIQLWHVGRISHSDFHDGLLPFAPSAVKARGSRSTPKGRKAYEVPLAMTNEDIQQTINDYRHASAMARKAGFDGVEIHGANGYLIEQFLSDHVNLRNDHYSGSVENRCRFALEVVKEVCKEWDNHQVGIRLSPSNLFNDMLMETPVETFDYLIEQLNNFDLAYLHLVEAGFRNDDLPKQYISEVTKHYRKIYKGTLITSLGYDKESGNKILEADHADLVAYGTAFISNPDLPKRFELNAEIQVADQRFFYAGEERGYTDYPFLESD